MTLIFLFGFSLSFWGCESTNEFMTVSEINTKITGSWQMAPIPKKADPEIWSFNGGVFRRQVFLYGNPSVVLRDDIGTYTCSTNYASAFVTLIGVPASTVAGKWTIIDLKGGVLRIVLPSVNGVGGGLLEKEFSKK